MKGVEMEFIWTKKIKMPVSMPMGKFTWTGVYGIQIGNTFIGIIRGFKNDKTNKTGSDLQHLTKKEQELLDRGYWIALR